jgi:hypothetical protein
VTRVVAVDDGGYGISRFVPLKTLFADDTAIGNDETVLCRGFVARRHGGAE